MIILFIAEVLLLQTKKSFKIILPNTLDAWLLASQLLV